MAAPPSSATEREVAKEVAVYTIALLAIAASPRLLPVGGLREPRSVVGLAKGLRAATADDVLARPIEALAAAIEQNIGIWLGISTEKATAFAAILKILPTLEPDAQRLAAANLDPRRLASYVSDRARTQSPAEFFESEADDKEQAAINAYILRTLLFRSLEHLQRVAMRAWVVRLLEDRLPVPALPEEPFLPDISDAVLEWEPEPSESAAGPAGDIAAGIAEVLGGLLTKPFSRRDDPSVAPPRSSDLPELKIGPDEVMEAASPAEAKPAGEAGAERRDRGSE